MHSAACFTRQRDLQTGNLTIIFVKRQLINPWGVIMGKDSWVNYLINHLKYSKQQVIAGSWEISWDSDQLAGNCSSFTQFLFSFKSKDKFFILNICVMECWLKQQTDTCGTAGYITAPFFDRQQYDVWLTLTADTVWWSHTNLWLLQVHCISDVPDVLWLPSTHIPGISNPHCTRWVVL